MNRKSLIVVAIVTAIAVLAAVSVQHRKKPASDVTANAGALLPDLSAQLDAVNKVRVLVAGGTEAVALQKGDKGWVVANRGGYPADAGKLRELALKLADARTIEAKTANRERYAQLGVEDVTAADAKGVLVELDGLAKPARVIVGNVNGGGGGGTFVRRADEDQSWLIGGTLTVERNAADWIARDLADIASSRIRDVVIQNAGKTLRIGKASAGDGNFVIADIPKGREASSEFAANGLASTLSGLRIDDVLPAAEAAPPADAIKASYALFNGVVVDAQAWTVDDKHRAQFVARLDEATADHWIGLEQAKADADYEAALAAAPKPDPAKPETAPAPPEKPLALSDPARDRADRLAAIQAEVEQLNARFGGWTVVIPAYKFDMINKGIDDLLAAPAAKATPVAKPGK